MFPSSSRIDRVEVKPVPRRSGRRRRCLGLGDGDVVEAVPFPAHEPGPHVDLLDSGVEDRAVAHPSHRREVAADRVERRDVGDVVPGDLEVVQVRPQAVGAGNPGDRLVVVVHDDVFAPTEAEREHLALPPRQVVPTFVCLLAQVLRGFTSGEMVEPDEPALRGVDQRPVLTRTGPVGREDVARRGVLVRHGDGQDRGLDAGQGVEALVVGERRRRVGELRWLSSDMGYRRGTERRSTCRRCRSSGIGQRRSRPARPRARRRRTACRARNSRRRPVSSRGGGRSERRCAGPRRRPRGSP